MQGRGGGYCRCSTPASHWSNGRPWRTFWPTRIAWPHEGAVPQELPSGSNFVRRLGKLAERNPQFGEQVKPLLDKLNFFQPHEKLDREEQTKKMTEENKQLIRVQKLVNKQFRINLAIGKLQKVPEHHRIRAAFKQGGASRGRKSR